MRKIGKLALVLGLAVVMTLAFASCGKAALADDPVVGTWNLTEAEYSGIKITKDDLKSVVDEMPVLTVNEDGSATLMLGSEESKGTVTAKDGGGYVLSDDSKQTIEFNIDNGKIKITDPSSGLTMIFEKK